LLRPFLVFFLLLFFLPPRPTWLYFDLCLLEASASERLNELVDLALMTLEILLTLVELVLLLSYSKQNHRKHSRPPRKRIHCHRFHLFRQVLLAIHNGLLRIVSTRCILFGGTECVTLSRSLIVVWAYETRIDAFADRPLVNVTVRSGAPHSTFQPV
jgi:hypothetical protein